MLGAEATGIRGRLPLACTVYRLNVYIIIHMTDSQQFHTFPFPIGNGIKNLHMNSTIGEEVPFLQKRKKEQAVTKI